ncbi:MAG: hypothetical protein ABIZ70_02825 [Gemmatimonadales bacterium]
MSNKSAVLVSVGLTLATASCGNAMPASAELRACEEFNSFGCVVIEGRVVGTRGQPLSGVSVGPRPSADGGQFNGIYDDTDADGRFSFRIYRMLSSQVASDSASLWIRAAIPPVLPVMAATIIDSALVRVLVTPEGRVPSRASVSITLPVE